MTKIAIFTRQIGPYHDARFRAAYAVCPGVTVVSTASQGWFKEFTSFDRSGAYPVKTLYNSLPDYDAAIRADQMRGAVFQALDEISPDCIAIGGWAAAESAAALLWAYENGCPCMIMSESQAFDAKRSRSAEWIKKQIVKLCNAALVGGYTHKQYMQDLGMADDLISLGYNAVDNEHFKTHAAAARQNADRLRVEFDLPDRFILASGRFIEKKNFPRLIRAYAEAKKAVPDAPSLVILGDGKERAIIEAEIAATAMQDSITLAGFRTYEQLPALYALSEGFVHVSFVEQWGLVINEAMSTGVPVIASQACGAASTVISQGKSGFLVDATKTASIADGLTKLFQMSPEERKTMGANAADAIAEWGPDRFGEGFARAISQTLKSPPRGNLWFWQKAMLDNFSKRIIRDVA